MTREYTLAERVMLNDKIADKCLSPAALHWPP